MSSVWSMAVLEGQFADCEDDPDLRLLPPTVVTKKKQKRRRPKHAVHADRHHGAVLPEPPPPGVVPQGPFTVTEISTVTMTMAVQTQTAVPTDNDDDTLSVGTTRTTNVSSSSATTRSSSAVTQLMMHYWKQHQKSIVMQQDFVVWKTRPRNSKKNPVQYSGCFVCPISKRLYIPSPALLEKALNDDDLFVLSESKEVAHEEAAQAWMEQHNSFVAGYKSRPTMICYQWARLSQSTKAKLASKGVDVNKFSAPEQQLS